MARMTLEYYCSSLGMLKNKKGSKLRVCDKCFQQLDGAVKTVARPMTKTKRKSLRNETIGTFLTRDGDDATPTCPSEEPLPPWDEAAMMSPPSISSLSSLGINSDDEEESMLLRKMSLAPDIAASAAVQMEQGVGMPSEACTSTRAIPVKELSKTLLSQQTSRLKADAAETQNKIEQVREEILQLDKALARTAVDDDRERKQLNERIERRGVLMGQLGMLETNRYFPEAMRWVLRLQPEPNLFFGIRDIDVDSLQANFQITAGKGECHIHVTDFDACLSVYEMKICGPTSKAKMLGSLLSPSRIDLHVLGEWRLPLRFGPKGKSKGGHAWTVLRDKAVFKLKVAKNVGGPTVALKLPDKLLQWLVNALLPNVISTAIRKALPDALGELFKEASNCVDVSGSVALNSDLKPSIWQAKLHKPLADSAEARSKLGITIDEAEQLFKTMKHPAAKAALFGQTMSMRGLHKFRLKYASYSSSELAPLLNGIERESGVATGWLIDIIERIDVLACKSELLEVALNGVNVSFDLYSFVHTVVDMQLDVMKETCLSLEAQIAEPSPRKGLLNRTGRKKDLPLQALAADALRQAWHDYTLAKKAAALTFTVTDIVSSVLEQLVFNLRLLVRGGRDGLALVSLDDLSLACRLPQLFEVVFPENVLYLSQLAMQGQQGPSKGEYKFRYFPITDGSRTETAVELILGHTKLEFEAGLLTGSTKRLCVQVLMDMLSLAVKKKPTGEDGEDASREEDGAGVDQRDAVDIANVVLPYILEDDHELLVEIKNIIFEIQRVTDSDQICRTVLSLRSHSSTSLDLAGSIHFQLCFGLSQLMQDFSALA